MFEKIREMLAEQLEFDVSGITEESSFMRDLGADSLDMADFAMELEDEYDIEIPDEVFAGFATVGDVVEYLKKNGVEE